MEENSPFEPTIFTAIWRYRVLVGLILVAAISFAAFFAIRLPPAYQATAVLVVEDPRASALFESGAVGRPERYANNQAAILVSGLVADRAASIASENGYDITTEEIDENLTVTVFQDSDELNVAFDAEQYDRSIVGANSVAAGYEQVRLEYASASFDRAIEQLNVSIDELNERLTVVGDEIESALVSDPARAALNEQYVAALARLSDLQAAVATATGENLIQLRAQLDDVSQQLATLQAVISIEQTSPELAALLAEQEQLISRRAELRARRDGFEVDESLESTGIIVFSPATAAEEVGLAPAATVAAAAILGGVLATVIAYALAVRNRRFVERSQPELVIGAPLLSSIPDFKEERLRSELPVRDQPGSASAESFRFVVAALHRASGLGRSSMRLEPFEVEKSFVVVSAAVGDGKSVVTANLTLATALQSNRVLAVDADFGDQRLTGLLTGSKQGVMDSGSPLANGELVERGLTDLVRTGVGLEEIVRTVEIEGFSPFDLISRGTAEITAPEFFGSGVAREFFRRIRDEYDIILIDAPPALQVAYSNSLIEYSDRAIVVVPHRSSVNRMEEVAARLEFLQARPLGYVYTRAPIRLDLPSNEGSMADVLGTGRAR